MEEITKYKKISIKLSIPEKPPRLYYSGGLILASWNQTVRKNCYY